MFLCTKSCPGEQAPATSLKLVIPTKRRLASKLSYFHDTMTCVVIGPSGGSSGSMPLAQPRTQKTRLLPHKPGPLFPSRANSLPQERPSSLTMSQWGPAIRLLAEDSIKSIDEGSIKSMDEGSIKTISEGSIHSIDEGSIKTIDEGSIKSLGAAYLMYAT